MDNQEYKVKQIWPAHADHITYYREKVLNEMFEHEQVVAQRKYDGERMLIHFNGDEVYCTSRRHSKKTDRYMENQDKLVDMPKIKSLDYTVIDCECYSTDWSSIVGILHSLPERAYDLQKTVPVKFAVFDCVYYDGVDVSELPYRQRYRLAQKVLNELMLLNKNETRFHIVKNIDVETLAQAYDIAEQHWNNGFEGVVIKSLDRKYYDKAAMLKIKRSETVDCVVMDWNYGTGKYANTVGALIIGYYDPEKDEVIRVSKVNAGTDADRNWWRDNWPEAKYNVIEVKCQEITEKSLRHPVYMRNRFDKEYKMCTRDTIFKN